ncbi:alpha/beta fold hydrolase [Paraburkholderia bryophila]|uniref:Esterase FrsA n=1 Tax=Paraburkholderia bryophila TaxID=420952 RepID=A0A329B7S6_9BURK|nr:alpha/beta fold hydrolase [Paraburkholderia bryophila]RAS15792.1 esterase FrsA [Paraburkholderia bryophila]
MFVFPLAPRELFNERRDQFMAWGIPRTVIGRVEPRVTDNWREGPGGWAYEWSQEAAAAAAGKQWQLAAALYGAARFPVICTPLRHDALRQQVRCFMLASIGFPTHFERVEVQATDDATTRIPIHLYRPKQRGDYPLVCLTGGVDTGKMELHRFALALARYGRFTVAAMDMPGTGETDMPLRADCDSVYRAVLTQIGGRAKKAIVGISFGGHWAAKLALQGEVDAAIDWGGPIGAARIDANRASRLPNGMTGIIANAARLPGMPDIAGTERLLQMFSLKDQGLLERSDCAPLLAVNGARDPYIPAGDVQVFHRYPSAQVWLLEGLGHCAAEAAGRVVPGMLAWLHACMHGDSARSRLALTLTQWLLPARVPGTSDHSA